MKNRIIIILLLILVTVWTNAKDILHSPIIGEYDKQQTTYLSLKDDKDHSVWNLSKLKVLDKNFHVSIERSKQALYLSAALTYQLKNRFSHRR